MRKERDPSDLTDAPWAVIAPLLPPPARTGRRRRSEAREVLNALCSIDKTGCHGRSLPRAFPRGPTVSPSGRSPRLIDAGAWPGSGHGSTTTSATPSADTAGVLSPPPPRSAAISDAQTVQTTDKGGSAAALAARYSPDVRGPARALPRGCSSRDRSSQREDKSATGPHPGSTAGADASRAWKESSPLAGTRDSGRRRKWTPQETGVDREIVHKRPDQQGVQVVPQRGWWSGRARGADGPDA